MKLRWLLAGMGMVVGALACGSESSDVHETPGVGGAAASTGDSGPTSDGSQQAGGAAGAAGSAGHAPCGDAGPDVPPGKLELPVPTGPYGIVRGSRRALVDSTRDLEGHSVDADGGASGATRPLSVEVWYPGESCIPGDTVPYMDDAEIGVLPPVPDVTAVARTHAHAHAAFASNLGPRPVLLFSPGYSCPPRIYTAFFEELVSHGYVVFAISHTLWTPLTSFADGTTMGATKELANADLEADSVVWHADAAFVLDQVVKANESDPLHEVEGHLDLSKIGMFGHSFGGSTSLGLLATDARVKAAADLDGGIVGVGEKTPISSPILLFQHPGYAPSIPEVFSNATGPAYYGTLAGSGHLNFSDLGPIALGTGIDPKDYPTYMLGSIDPRRAVQDVEGYLLAFFGKWLEGEDNSLLDGPSDDFPDVVDYKKKP